MLSSYDSVWTQATQALKLFRNLKSVILGLAARQHALKSELPSPHGPFQPRAYKLDNLMTSIFEATVTCLRARALSFLNLESPVLNATEEGNTEPDTLRIQREIPISEHV